MDDIALITIITRSSAAAILDHYSIVRVVILSINCHRCFSDHNFPFTLFWLVYIINELWHALGRHVMFRRGIHLSNMLYFKSQSTTLSDDELNGFFSLFIPAYFSLNTLSHSLNVWEHIYSGFSFHSLEKLPLRFTSIYSNFPQFFNRSCLHGIPKVCTSYNRSESIAKCKG